MWEGLQSLTEQHPQLLAWSSLIGIALSLGSLLLLPAIFIQLPEDYLVDRTARQRRRHPLVRLLLLVMKNTCGATLLLLGLLMLVLPGQGLLTILAGLLLLDFPGKAKLELRLIQRPLIFRSVSRLRKRAGKPPLRLP